MLIINLSHPLTAEQLSAIAERTGQPADQVWQRMPQFDHQRSLVEQIATLLDEIGLSAEEWQNVPILLNPPGFAPAAAVALAQIHGRSGHFPALIRLRPMAGSIPTRYELAELINLDAVRNDMARLERQA
jgi:transposase